MSGEEPTPRERLTSLRTDASERLDASSGMLSALTRDREGANDDDEHDPDGATLSTEWSRLTGLVDAAESALQQVDDALVRLDAGTYGVCVDCGRPIPDARLRARPFAVRCVPCAERAGR